MRFIQKIDGGEDVYDVYMAKKKSGKPKDGEPSKFIDHFSRKCYKVACLNLVFWSLMAQYLTKYELMS